MSRQQKTIFNEKIVPRVAFSTKLTKFLGAPNLDSY